MSLTATNQSILSALLSPIGLTPILLVLALAFGSSSCALYEEPEPLDRSLAVNELEISPDPVRLELGQTTQLSARLLDRGGDEVNGLDVEWSSANTSVVEVDADGVVEGKAIGDTTVTAQVGDVTATTTVVVFTPVQRIEIEPDPADLDIGAKLQLSATVYGDNDEILSGRQLEWTSSDEAVVTVDADGQVTGVSEGQAVVRARTTGVSGSAEITVLQPVGRVELDPTDATIEVTDTLQLTASVFDTNDEPQDRTVNWSSTQPDIASVDAAGLVEGLQEGQTTIVAEAGGVRAQATVVVEAPVAEVEISPSPASVGAGRTLQLTAKLTDAAGNELSGRDLAWQTSDDTVATVDGDGLVSGLMGGQVTITASSEGVDDTVQVTVDDPVAIVDVSPDPLNLTVSDTGQLTATLEDAAGNELTGRSVTWRSDDTTIATVDGTGLVTAKDEGVVNITATAEGVSDTAQVTVANSVASVEVTPTAPTIDVGETVQLTAVAKNSRGAVVSGRTVTWTSSDPTVVSVDATGTIEGLEDGSATVTAQVDNVTGTASVTVQASVASVTIGTPSTMNIEVTETLQLAAELRDAGGNLLSGHTVNWSSSDSAVATVDQAGLVTALAGGQVTITAESEQVTDTVTISVDDPPRSVEVSPSSATVDVASTVQLSATPRDLGGNALSGYTISWSSSDTGVATVDSSGVVTGESEGNVTITASVDDGTGTIVSGTASVQVDAPVSTVVVDPTYAFIFPGEQAQINVTLEDAAGNTLSGRTVTWASQYTNIATVDSSGLITAVSVGSTTISAESEGISATVDLDVVEWTQVSTGDSYTCGVLSNGNGYCWGRNSPDGRLGDGTQDSGTQSSLNGDADSNAPSLVQGGLDFEMIEPGFFHTCGLTTAGRVYCWGANGAGHLGDGTSSSSPTPVAVSGSHTFVDLVIGANHACALDTSGDVYCWGSNQEGQLGLGSGSGNFSLVPQKVPNLTFASITSGAAHTCGLTLAGDAYCWGEGSSGQLGDGSGSMQMSPVAVDTTDQFSVIESRWSHTCAISTSNSAVYCWGSNQYGELGDGTTNPSQTPLLADDARAYSELALGAGASCAIDASSDAYCWGFNGQGNLGSGTVASSQSTPRLVSGGYSWTAIALGRQHSCGLAAGQADAFCWGDNDNGQLGNGTTQNYLSAPTQVTTP